MFEYRLYFHQSRKMCQGPADLNCSKGGQVREWCIEMVYLDENTNECKLSLEKVFWEDG